MSFDYDPVATRTSLLSRLRNADDDESWRTFFDLYWRLLYNVARKSGLADEDAQDVVQETVIAVARKMPEFRYDPVKGSFKQWLLLITRRRIQDHLRRRYRSGLAPEASSKEPASGTENVPAPTLTPDATIEATWESAWRENVYQAALARVRQRVHPKNYQVFDCCVIQGLPVAEVARMLGLNVAQVYLAKHRVSRSVQRTAAEIEAELDQSALR